MRISGGHTDYISELQKSGIITVIEETPIPGGRHVIYDHIFGLKPADKTIFSRNILSEDIIKMTLESFHNPIKTSSPGLGDSCKHFMRKGISSNGLTLEMHILQDISKKHIKIKTSYLPAK